MALAAKVVADLRMGLGDGAAATELTTLLNSHTTGTMGTRLKQCLRTCFASNADAKTFITAVEGHTALSAHIQSQFGRGLGSRYAATKVAAELLV